MKSYICLIILILILFPGCVHYDKFQVSNKAFYWYKDNSKKYALRKDYGMFEVEAYCRRKCRNNQYFVSVIIHNQTDYDLLVRFDSTVILPREKDAEMLVEVNKLESETGVAKVPSHGEVIARLISPLEARTIEMPLADSVCVKGIRVLRPGTDDAVEVEPLSFTRLPDKIDES